MRNKIEIDLTNPGREGTGTGGLSDGSHCILGLTPDSFLLTHASSFPVRPVWGVNWRPRLLPRLQILLLPSTTCHYSRGISENGRGLGGDESLCWMPLFFTAEMPLRIEIALKNPNLVEPEGWVNYKHLGWAQPSGCLSSAPWVGRSLHHRHLQPHTVTVICSLPPWLSAASIIVHFT